jgi:DNA-directed RNA polymerase subunit RPC12/RpoP
VHVAEKQRVTVSQTIECDYCETLIDVLFVAPEGVWEAQDIEEPLTAEVTCPECGRKSTEEYSGWSNYDDA